MNLSFLSFLYPNLCLICKREIRKLENSICLHCLNDTITLNFQSSNNPIFQLFWGKVNVNFATSCFSFIKGEKIQKIIHEFKYNGNRKLAFDCGMIMGLYLQNNPALSDVDAISFVPSTWVKNKKRGYNQAAELCKGICVQTSLPMINVLGKKKEKGSQTNKSVLERHFELDKSYYLKNKRGVSTFKHIVIIDDVITTGATLAACSSAIVKNTDTKVSILTFAYRDI